ncbi:ATP-grasp domain-containing protein [Polyangium aurulentum]|uniref:ATP-grasp domain-containing protein n=1 Tax=Polyangium aurulentum TaxID=2567896 RepID=UPI00146DA5EB|nr:ATP-grasp domain-containing protein [Polyangium aurulentum]UQA61790.1 ATP-grasp domain-containing protein [Polyangium aurulentum]
MKKILMVGMHDGYASMFRNDRDLELYVLEEEALYKKNSAAYESYKPAGILLTKYQQSDDFRAAALQWHREIGFDAVAPAWEYGVHASGVLAETFGLRSPGRRALEACTDKLVLREMLSSTSIRQPRWARVSSVDDVARFHRGTPIILKPSNRHASVGVIRVDDAAHIADAWQECVTANESRTVADRPRAVELMVEEFVPGYQVSVETLVRDRKVVFDNVCLMLTAGGPYFPILSVTVPAPIPSHEYEAAVAASHSLVASLEVENGMIHSEWKVCDSHPYLIESAARVPGAFTPELAEKAYGGFNMYRAQVRNLAGLDPLLPGPERSIASVRWFHPPSGKLKAIHGADALEADPAVFLRRIKIAQGDEVPVCRDGWHRIGYFAAHAPTKRELDATVSRILETVVFDMEPSANS